MVGRGRATLPEPPVDADDEWRGDGLLVRYLVRAVRIGVVATFLILVPIGLYPLLDPQASVVWPGVYYGAVATGLLGAGVVVLLPWPRLLRRRHPMTVLYLWSVGDILLITLLVLATGGIASPLWAVYTLTTLFFAATVPRGPQVALFVFTVAAYLVAVVAAESSADDTAALLALRLGVLAVLALMAGFISSELTRQMAAHARRAQASHRVAAAGTDIGALDQPAVLDAAVRAVADLGFPVCAVVLLESSVYKVVASHGLPTNFDRVRLILSELRPTRQAWVMRHGDIDDEGVLEVLRATGCEALIAAPLLVGTRRVGLLAAGGDDDPAGVEAVQTLATLTSNALENAELYRLKTDFVANVSHELRTPLTVLVGLGETLAQHSGELTREQVEELAGRIQINAGRLDRMITTLLDFSRLQAEQRHIEHEEVDLSVLAVEAVRRCETRLAPRQVRVDVPSRALATGDQVMLEQVIDNLLANVASHTPPETTATVEVRQMEDTVEVVIGDDGPGIAAEDLERVTERFFRGGDHLTRDSRGLGLGLALVQELLALNHSHIEVRPSERGARIAFRLPRADVPAGRTLDEAPAP